MGRVAPCLEAAKQLQADQPAAFTFGDTLSQSAPYRGSVCAGMTAQDEGNLCACIDDQIAGNLLAL